MNGALETLFFAAKSDTIHSENCSTIFVNSFYHKALEDFDKTKIYVQQYFCPLARNLEKHGFEVYDSFDGVQEHTKDLALVMVPKNMVEARYFVAKAIMMLRDGGTLICAADNKAGGTRLKKMMQDFGFDEPMLFSQNKARAVRVTMNKAGVDNEALADALKAGEMQLVLDGRFVSQPGIFGWDKIDNGSRILLENLPLDLKGRGADFGCGYGFLSFSILEKCRKIKKLYCIDADKRALVACQQNLRDKEVDGCPVEYLWRDLVSPQSDLKNLDFVVMNPPFHEGKNTDVSVGASFIERAYESLRRGGRLWMVANKHLPYEPEITKRFYQVHRHYEGQGFKIFECVK